MLIIKLVNGETYVPDKIRVFDLQKGSVVDTECNTSTMGFSFIDYLMSKNCIMIPLEDDDFHNLVIPTSSILYMEINVDDKTDSFLYKQDYQSIYKNGKNIKWKRI